MAKLSIPFKVVELDKIADGDEVQGALQGISGMSTVPQVFIGGKLLGGCDGERCCGWGLQQHCQPQCPQTGWLAVGMVVGCS